MSQDIQTTNPVSDRSETSQPSSSSNMASSSSATSSTIVPLFGDLTEAERQSAAVALVRGWEDEYQATPEIQKPAKLSNLIGIWKGLFTTFGDFFTEGSERLVDFLHELPEEQRSLVAERHADFLEKAKGLKTTKDSREAAFAKLIEVLFPERRIEDLTITPSSSSKTKPRFQRGKDFLEYLTRHRSSGMNFYHTMRSLANTKDLPLRNLIHLLNDQIIYRNRKVAASSLPGMKTALKSELLGADILAAKDRIKSLNFKITGGYFAKEGYKIWELKELGLTFDKCGILCEGDIDNHAVFPYYDDEDEYEASFGRKNPSFFPVRVFHHESEVCEPAGSPFAAVASAPVTEAEPVAQDTPRVLRSADPSEVNNTAEASAESVPETPTNKRKRKAAKSTPRKSARREVEAETSNGTKDSGSSDLEGRVEFSKLNRLPTSIVASAAVMDESAMLLDNDEDFTLPEQEGLETSLSSHTNPLLPSSRSAGYYDESNQCSCVTKSYESYQDITQFSSRTLTQQKNALLQIKLATEKPLEQNQQCFQHLVKIAAVLGVDLSHSNSASKLKLRDILIDIYEVVKGARSLRRAWLHPGIDNWISQTEEVRRYRASRLGRDKYAPATLDIKKELQDKEKGKENDMNNPFSAGFVLRQGRYSWLTDGKFGPALLKEIDMLRHHHNRSEAENAIAVEQSLHRFSLDNSYFNTASQIVWSDPRIWYELRTFSGKDQFVILPQAAEVIPAGEYASVINKDSYLSQVGIWGEVLLSGEPRIVSYECSDDGSEFSIEMKPGDIAFFRDVMTADLDLSGDKAITIPRVTLRFLFVPVRENGVSLGDGFPTVAEVAEQHRTGTVEVFGKTRLLPPYLSRLPPYDELDDMMRGNIGLDNPRLVVCLSEWISPLQKVIKGGSQSNLVQVYKTWVTEIMKTAKKHLTTSESVEKKLYGEKSFYNNFCSKNKNAIPPEADVFEISSDEDEAPAESTTRPSASGTSQQLATDQEEAGEIEDLVDEAMLVERQFDNDLAGIGEPVPRSQYGFDGVDEDDFGENSDY